MVGFFVFLRTKLKLNFQIMKSKGDVVITNDGATILKQMELAHPCAKMVNYFISNHIYVLQFSSSQLVDLAKAQDVEVGDGTTTVTVLAGALLGGCQDLLAKGIHPTTIAEGYQRAAAFAIEILRSISEKVCSERQEMILLFYQHPLEEEDNDFCHFTYIVRSI